MINETTKHVVVSGCSFTILAEFKQSQKKITKVFIIY